MGFSRLSVNLTIQSTLVIVIFLDSLLVCPHITSSALAESLYLETKPGHLVPDALLYPNLQNPGYIIIVEKSSQKAYLYRSDNIGSEFMIYSCSTGQNRGPKSNKNDKKTPEGVYFITNSYKEKDLTSIYGSRAFPIDYPNPRDRKLGRTGYGIWIHGTNESLKPWDTNGCIVFSNHDIVELAEYAGRKHTPVIITERIKYIAGEKLQKESLELKEFIIDWVRAWQEGLIDRCMSFYCKDFSGSEKNRHPWQAYKKLLNEKHGTIDIKIDTLQIFRENGVALAKFDQSYETDGFFSEGEKRLYLHKKGDKWKIIDEFFERRK
jgi:murein L,D-transpeptidase YafK